MINSYRDITGKYLRANKKRTILTLIGVILSVSLISSIGFFLKSMQAAQIQDTKNNYGSWHVMYKNADEGLITKIKSNPLVVKSGTYAIGNEISLNEKLKVREVYGSEKGLELLPYKLKDGRFPKNNTEAAVEEWFLGKIKSHGKLGDTIKVNNREYTLVGILSDTYRNQLDGVGELVTNNPEAGKGQKILLVELNLNRKLRQNIDELTKLSDKSLVSVNQNLIIAEGQGMPKGLTLVMTIIIGIVVISTIAVIYNAFQISVVERVKQFGLLRAVGATPRQIRKIILREAAFLALIAIPIGLCFGIAALYGIDLTFKLIGGKDLVFITPTISLDVVFLSILIGLISIYLSALLPAIFAGKISPLVAISSRNSITKEKIKRRKSLIIGKIFGFEGVLASKNIKRNKRRYRITVFSIVISVTLFISFKSFMDMSFKVYAEMNESNSIHFSVVNSGRDNAKVDDDIIERINNLSYIDTTYRVYDSYNFDAVIDKTKEIKDVRDIGTIYRNINYEGQDKTLMGASLVVYDDKSIQVARNYLKEGSIDIEKLNKENGVIIIDNNRIYNQKTKKNFYGSLTDLKPGDEIYLQLNEFGQEGKERLEFGQGQVKKIKVLAVLKGNPFNYRGSEAGIKMITTEDVAAGLTSSKIYPVGLDIKIKDTKLENTAKKDIEDIINDGDNLRLINIIDQNRTSKSAILMVKILLYGFVIVVSLIGSVNIINTLTTNIILRRREFAALKSIGLTQRGLRKMITLEGVLYGIMGSIYGAVAGSFLSYLLYRGINDVREQSYKLPLESIAIAAIGAMIIGCLSVMAPIKRMKRDNLIDAVREDF